MAVAALACSPPAFGGRMFLGRVFFDGFAAADKGYRHLLEHNLEYLDNGRENIIDCYCALTAAVRTVSCH